jgi:hypothetical protein
MLYLAILPGQGLEAVSRIFSRCGDDPGSVVKPPAVGLAEKAEEFKKAGAEIYVKA